MPKPLGAVKGGVSKVYAVKRGRKTGLFSSWPEVQDQVNGFPGAQHKSFKSMDEALEWLGGAGRPAANGAAAPATARSMATLAAAAVAVAPPSAQPPLCRGANSMGPVEFFSGVAFLPTLVATAEDDATQPYPHSHHQPPPSGSRGSALEQRHGAGETSNGPAPPPAARSWRSDNARRVVRRMGTVKPNTVYTVAFDGGSRGNPGCAGSGAAVIEAASGTTVAEVMVPLGTTTNNVAEYQGLIHGLEVALEMGVRKVEAVGDSLLVCSQVEGVWKCKHDNLRSLHARVLALRPNFESFSIRHVLREYNAHADRLSNEAMDMR